MGERSRKILIHWLVCLFISGLVLSLLLYFKGATWTTASDSCFFLGVFFLAWPVLVLLYRSGIFDTANYGLLTFFSSFRPNSPKPYENAYVYREKKKSDRSANKPILVPCFVFGSLMMVLATIFLFLFYSTL
jgi:hypothetical protein